MDDFVVPTLPDLSGMTMLDLMSCEDPELLALVEERVQRILNADPEDGCC